MKGQVIITPDRLHNAHGTGGIFRVTRGRTPLPPCDAAFPPVCIPITVSSFGRIGI